jgi:hypothetical protein
MVLSFSAILGQTSLPTSWPTSLPAGLSLEDPFVRNIALATGAFILIVILLRVLGARREAATARRRAAEVRRGYEELRLQQEEVRRLGERIVATSSTNRIVGYAVLRQFETVFSDTKPSSVAAVELVKALAAQKGANALINLDTRQLPNGKWVASGDAVVVKLLGRTEKPPAGPPGDAPQR